jgi:hypothetical protein
MGSSLMTDDVIKEIAAELEATRKQLTKIQSKINSELAKRRDDARCGWMKNSNVRCLLAIGHEGQHQQPCVEHGAHRPHHHDRGAYYVDCGGRVFDLT